MANLIMKNLRLFLDNITPIQREVLNIVEDTEGCWIAGGAPLALYRKKANEVRDWDLYFDSKINVDAVKSQLLSLGYQERENRSSWSVSYSKEENIVQTIDYKFFTSPEDIFSSFDISVCCFAVEGDTLIFTETAKEDVKNGVMNFISTKHPVICIKRIAKYARKGFMPTTNFAMGYINLVRGMNDRDIRFSEGITNNQNGES